MKRLVYLRLRPYVEKQTGWEIVLDHDGLTPLFKFSILEPPWRDNANGHGDYRKASCIPSGTYDVRFEEDKDKITPEGKVIKGKGFIMVIEGVPSRSMIWQHRGVDEKDTLGCLCEGLAFTKEGNLTDTRKAQNKLKALFKVGERATITIIDANR